MEMYIADRHVVDLRFRCSDAFKNIEGTMLYAWSKPTGANHLGDMTMVTMVMLFAGVHSDLRATNALFF